ncbi:MAG TPA: Crp/Fnr family transcriptional regulator [Anaerolineales bacterium]
MINNPPGKKAVEILSGVSYFKGLADSTLKSIAQAAIKRVYNADQLVILEGGPSSGLYIVEAGWLKVVKIAIDGREQILQFLGPGEAFNAVGVFTDRPSPATVIALETTTVWIVLRERMLRLLDEHSDLAHLVIEDMAGRVTHLISLVEDLSLRTVEARLARQLLDQSEGNEIRRKRWATQAEMAARIGTVPDVLNRALRQLAEQGLIRVDRKRIEILDRVGLEEKARVDI